MEGFTAEVGASGSFCPPHLLLPVTAAFYDLHDNHGGTSPYLVSVMITLLGEFVTCLQLEEVKGLNNIFVWDTNCNNNNNNNKNNNGVKWSQLILPIIYVCTFTP